MKAKGPVLTPLNLEFPVWEQVFTVHPLIIVGTVNKDASPNFAPKHMVFPLGWKNYFGFVCTPRHQTYKNIKETGEFTITYPKPEQLIETSLTSSPRSDDKTKPALKSIETFPAIEMEGHFVKDGYIFLECRINKIIDGFGDNSLILGEIVAARAWSDVLKNPSHTDDEVIYNHPNLVYVSPGRYAIVDETYAFPYPENFKE